MYGKKSAASSHKANDKYMEDFEEAYQSLSVRSTVKSGGPPAPPLKSHEGATNNAESLLPNPILACNRMQLDISPSFKRGPMDPAGFQFDVSDRNLFAMDYSHSGEYFTCGGASHEAIEYSLRTGKERRRLYSKTFGHTEWITCLSYLPDGRIVTGGMDSRVCLWNSGGARGTELKGHRASISTVRTTACGGYILTGSYDKSIKLWSSKNQKEIVSLEGHTAPILDMKLASMYGSRLLSGDRNGLGILWDLNSGKKLRKLTGHRGHITALDFMDKGGDEGGYLAVTGDQQGLVNVWDPRVKDPVVSSILHAGGAVNCIAIGRGATNMNKLITAGADRRIVIIDPRTWEVETTISDHKDFIYSLTTAGNLVFSGAGNGLLLVHDISDNRGKLLYGLGANMAAVRCIEVVDQSTLITCGDDGKALKYDF